MHDTVGHSMYKKHGILIQPIKNRKRLKCLQARLFPDGEYQQASPLSQCDFFHQSLILSVNKC